MKNSTNLFKPMMQNSILSICHNRHFILSKINSKMCLLSNNLEGFIIIVNSQLQWIRGKKTAILLLNMLVMEEEEWRRCKAQASRAVSNNEQWRGTLQIANNIFCKTLTRVRLHILNIRLTKSQSIEQEMQSTWIGPYRSVPSSGQYWGHP